MKQTNSVAGRGRTTRLEARHSTRQWSLNQLSLNLQRTGIDCSMRLPKKHSQENLCAFRTELQTILEAQDLKQPQIENAFRS